MINSIEEFYITECRNNPSKLKYTLLANYIRSKGYDIKDYDIRRSQEAVDFIKSIKEKAATTTEINVCMFKSLDIDEFLSNHTSIVAIKKALIQRDQYYMEVASSASYYIKNYKKLEKNNTELEAEIIKYKKVNNELNERIDNMAESKKDLISKIHTLTSVINTHVYPEIANKLLRIDGSLLVNEKLDIINVNKTTIDEDVTFEEVITRNEKTKSDNTVIQGYVNRI